jgi:raffinose/stachyose/melibiose transport system substrate-binding protein
VLRSDGRWSVRKRPPAKRSLKRRLRLWAPLVLAATLVSSCAPPGSVADTTTTEQASPSTEAAASPSTAPESTMASSGPDCGTEPVVMQGYHEDAITLTPDLTAEFSKQFPNVTWELRTDTFANLMTTVPRLLAGDNPPDIVRVTNLVDLHKDGLLLNLDPYFDAYGWDEFPASQIDWMRVSDDGTRGVGHLYGFGQGFSLTGVYYNRELADEIGMTEVPKTLAEFDDLLGRAKAAGIQPIVQHNASDSGGGLAFPLQQLMASYGPATPINDWVYGKADATIDTPSNVDAAEHLKEWLDAGYFTSDLNALQYADAQARFGQGEALFTFNGDWQNGGFDNDLPGGVGFFLFPPMNEGDPYAAMSAPALYTIPANAPNPDCAAFYANWVATNPTARQIEVDLAGSNPGGPPSLPLPTVAADSVTNETLAAGPVVADDNGFMDFIANATQSIFFGTWTPELQKLAADKQTPEGLLQAVQAAYEEELGR